MNRTSSSAGGGAFRGVTRALTAAIVAGAACADPDRSALATEPGIQQSVLRTDPFPALDGGRAAIEDALTRNIPVLEDPLAAAPLQAALAALAKHLEDGNDEALRGAITAAHHAIAAYEQKVGTQGPDAPDLDAVRLALDTAAY